MAVYHRGAVAVDKHLVGSAHAAGEFGVDARLRQYGEFAQHYLHLAVHAVAHGVDVFVFLLEGVAYDIRECRLLHADYGGTAVVHVVGYLLYARRVAVVEHIHVVRHHLDGAVGSGMQHVEG